MRCNALPFGVAMLLACGASTGGEGMGDCVSQHPAAEPFDVGNVDVASPAPGSTAVPAPPPSVTSIAAECEASGGSGCDPAAFISKEAAACLAAQNHFDVGLEAWSVALVYHHGFDRVVWNVTNKLQDRGADGYSGGTLTLDATAASVLGETTYNATP